MDPGLNQLLKWSIENTPATNDTSSSTANSVTLPHGSTAESTTTQTPSERALDASALNSLLGGPSDADLMKASIAAMSDHSLSSEARMTAADNLEQLIESLDNANLLEPLGLWPTLFSFLSDAESDIRMMAAWCVGTAVQNNLPAQEAALKVEIDGRPGGGMAKLVDLARGDASEQVRGKAARAVSSWVRNFQKGLDALLEVLGSGEKTSAGDMEGVDAVISQLKGV